MKVRGIMFMVLLVAGLVLVSVLSKAAPTDPFPPTTLTQTDTSRLDIYNYPNQTIDAEAGNISALIIDTTSVTNAWAGYYGNISGVITLDDASGNTFYNWTNAEPKGEIYATTNYSITWANIECFNYSGNPAVDGINLTTEEDRYSIVYNDVDGIDETFYQTNHPTFWVGTYEITTNTCPSTNVFRDDAPQTAEFFNVLLSDNSSLLFTTIIENDDIANNTDITGYNGEIMDFQMLVAEDGHNGTGQDTLTTYYFFVDLA